MIAHFDNIVYLEIFIKISSFGIFLFTHQKPTIFISAMEDQVPFKVYTFWRENDKPEVRRFGVEKSVVTSFHYLNAKLQDVYPGLKGKTYSVAWKGNWHIIMQHVILHDKLNK